MRPCTRAACAALAFVASLLAGAAAGQDLLTLAFSFDNPGARSMGFGGAFAAVADDATAAFANPAGLVQITRPEVSIEGRLWNLSLPFSLGDFLSGPPTGPGFPLPDLSELSATVSVVGFQSFVYPRKRWRLALYRHELADVSVNERIRGLRADPGDELRDVLVNSNLKAVVVGLTAAYRVSEDLSLGLGLTHFTADLSTSQEVFLPTVPFLPGRRVAETRTSIDDTDEGLTAGVLWRFAQGFQLAGFYRQGPELLWSVEALDLGQAAVRGTSPMSFPDVFGLGVAYRSADGRLTVSWEWDRVEYSTIFASLSPELAAATQTSVPDADEIHLGGEYAFLEATPLFAIRIGAWLDPDHGITGTGDSIFEQTLLQPGEDQIHLAVGFGLAFQRLQIDVAADFSEPRDTLSVSAVYSF